MKSFQWQEDSVNATVRDTADVTASFVVKLGFNSKTNKPSSALLCVLYSYVKFTCFMFKRLLCNCVHTAHAEKHVHNL